MNKARLFWLLFLPLLANATPSEFRYIDTPHSWPYSYADEAQLKGLLPYAIQKAVQASGTTLKSILAPDLRALNQVAQNRADGTFITSFQSQLFGNIHLDELAKGLFVCRHPILTGTVALLTPKSVSLSDDRKELQLKLPRIGFLKLATVQSSYASQRDNPNSNSFYSTILMVKSLFAGRIDAVIGEPVVINRIYQSLTPSSPPLKQTDIGHYQIHIALNPDWGEETDKIQLCRALKALSSSGEIRRQLQQFMAPNTPIPNQ